MPLQVTWSYILLAYTALFSLGLLDNSRGPFFPDLVQDLQLSDSRGALFFAMTAFMGFWGSYWAGRWAERSSARRGMQIGLLIMGAGFFLISIAQSLWELMLYCGVFGVGFGAVSVFQNVLVHIGATERYRRRLFSGLHSMYAFSSLTAPLVISWMFHWQWNWRDGFRWVAVVPIAVAFMGLMVPEKDKDVVEGTDQDPLGTPPAFSHKLLMSFTMALYVWAEVAASTRLVLFVRRDWLYSAESASLLLAAFFALLLVGRLVFTVFELNRYSNFMVLSTSFLLSAILFALGLFFHPICLVLSGLTMAPFFSVAMDYHVEVFKTHASSSISLTVAMFLLTAVAMHYGMGWITEEFGVRQALLVGPISLVVGFILLQWQARHYLNASPALPRVGGE